MTDVFAITVSKEKAANKIFIIWISSAKLISVRRELLYMLSLCVMLEYTFTPILSPINTLKILVILQEKDCCIFMLHFTLLS